MSRQYFSETVIWATADGTAIANTTTETIIFPNTTFPANYMADGRVLRLTAYGRYSTTTAPTMTFRIRWGGVSGTVLASSGAVTMGSSVTAAMWKVEILLVVRANGSSGSIFATGEAVAGTATSPTVGTATNMGTWAFMGSAGVATPAAVTVDLTGDTPLSITGTWSAASASNTLTGHNLIIESLN